MSIVVSGIETTKQIIGEYPMHQVGEQVGLFDYSELVKNDKYVANYDVLQVLAKLAGGAVYLTNPTSEKSQKENSNNARHCHGEKSALGSFIQAVVFEKPNKCIDPISALWFYWYPTCKESEALTQ